MSLIISCFMLSSPNPDTDQRFRPGTFFFPLPGSIARSRGSGQASAGRRPLQARGGSKALCRNARKIESCNGGEILRRLCLLRMTGDLIRPGVRHLSALRCAGKAFRAAEDASPYGGDGGQTVVSIAESRAGQFSPCIFPLSFSKGSRRQPLRHPPCGRWRMTPPLAQGRFSPMNSAFRTPNSAF